MAWFVAAPPALRAAADLLALFKPTLWVHVELTASTLRSA